MKILLYQLFAQYGKVLEVNTKRQYRMRGQAFVVYENKEDGMNAMRLLQGFYFYGKPMVTSTQRISYAKSKSDVIAKREGTFKPRSLEEQDDKREEFFEKLRAKEARKHGKRAEVSTNGFQASNHILFIENLTHDVTDDILLSLFSQYPGFTEVRLIREKSVAFVEFMEAHQAAIALSGLNGFRATPSCPLSITYAKR